MTATLAQTQADLPRLLEIVSSGEDVFITVEGRPKARLTRPENGPGSRLSAADLQQWMAELAEFRARLATGKTTPSAEDLIEEDRADRTI